ncbi:ImmA/IrrE family metallo-endopeptidase [Pantoea agglomerans]|uniref:ImmA/IrrE family metallo-endopeptidase n=1 Tax=Enterobacter agglomerans TaxID=549 RepID=UPI003209BA79
MEKKINIDQYIDLEDSLPTISSGSELNQLSKLADLMFWIDENEKNIPYKELLERHVISGGGNNHFEIFNLLSRTIKSSAATLFRAGNLTESNKRDSLVFIWQGLINRQVKEFSHLPPYREDLTKESISEIVKMSTKVYNLPKIKDLLATRGIAFIIEKSLPGLGIDGLVYKNKNGNPIISMSLRYDRLDNFWFTLAHELSHIVLHYKFLDQPIIEDFDTPYNFNLSDIEEEANYLASESIISNSVWRRCEFRRKHTEESLNALAQEQSIHPILLAGKLRKELNNYEIFSKLINSYSVREALAK